MDGPEAVSTMSIATMAAASGTRDDASVVASASSAVATQSNSGRISRMGPSGPQMSLSPSIWPSLLIRVTPPG